MIFLYSDSLVSDVFQVPTRCPSNPTTFLDVKTDFLFELRFGGTDQLLSFSSGSVYVCSHCCGVDCEDNSFIGRFW